MAEREIGRIPGWRNVRRGVRMALVAASALMAGLVGVLASSATPSAASNGAGGSSAEAVPDPVVGVIEIEGHPIIEGRPADGVVFEYQEADGGSWRQFSNGGTATGTAF